MAGRSSIHGVIPAQAGIQSLAVRRVKDIPGAKDFAPLVSRLRGNDIVRGVGIAIAMVLLPAPASALDLPAKTDPAFAEAWNGCLNAIEGGGVLDEALGWTSHDTGDVDAQGWDNWTGGFATKDVEGVGGYNLSIVVENYPGYDVGLCDVRVDSPQRDIDGPPLKSNGFPGSLQGDGGAWSGAWRSEDASLFVRSLYSSDTATFRLSMTKITPVAR